ncbi:MAG: CHAD domain-containing protein [Acidimicrobiales bacterium]
MAGADHTLEREVKLEVPDGFVLPDLAAATEGLAVEEVSVADHVDTYFDTPDLRLIRSGITVRHRQEGPLGVWTVKLPAGDLRVAGGMSRLEVTREGRPGRVPAGLVRLVLAHVRTASVRRVARLQTTRRSILLRAADGVPAARIDDDTVAAEVPDQPVARFRELEVELDPGTSEELLGRLVDAMRAAGAAPADPTPKLARGLGPAATAPAELDFDADETPTSVGAVVRTALAGSVRRIVDHDPIIRLDLDPEGVHQVRVGTRRLRADLRTFRPVLDREWADGVRDELRWLGRALGEVRDRDVLLLRLRDHVSRLAEVDREPGERLLRRLAVERDDARERLLRALTGRRYRELLDGLVDAVDEPRFATDADPDGDPADLMPALVSRPWRKVRKRVRRLGDAPRDEELHRVRVLAKRARYAAEAVAPVAGRPAEKLASALAKVQDELGEVNDAVVAEAWLREAANDASTSETFVAGLLATRHRFDGDRHRQRWPRRWSTADRRKWTVWLN